MNWQRIRDWFAGKKTMLGGCLVIAAGVAAVALGKLAPVKGMAIIGLGISICGWSAKANRYQTQILGALEAVAVAGSAYRSGDKGAAARSIAKVVAADVVQSARIQTGVQH